MTDVFTPDGIDILDADGSIIDTFDNMARIVFDVTVAINTSVTLSEFDLNKGFMIEVLPSPDEYFYRTYHPMRTAPGDPNAPYDMATFRWNNATKVLSRPLVLGGPTNMRIVGVMFK